jgi:hypothetical protein
MIMTDFSIKTGYSYFQKTQYFLQKQVSEWMSSLNKLGASMVVFESTFSRAIPEDVLSIAKENGIEPIVHFTSELPLARKFNDVSILLDVYAKWGAKGVILGDRPNIRQSWPDAGWHFENLVDHFLDRFIPLANYAVRIGLTPILPPLQPGGDYWDTAFAELILSGLRQRRMDDVLDKLVLGCYGFTFNKPISWGSGGPERWPLSKPYLTPDGQEDQLGFHNYEWIQAMGEHATGKKFPVLILNAGHPGTVYSQPDPERTLMDINSLQTSCIEKCDNESLQETWQVDESIMGIVFSLMTLEQIIPEQLTPDLLEKTFLKSEAEDAKTVKDSQNPKIIPHYLLLPSHASGVSDVVLSKVRPIIKKFQPTVGFSLDEAIFAQKVSIYPDPLLFKEEQINALRSAGCHVDILPESGIDIATSLQGS